MQLTSLLRPDCVRLVGGVSSKKRLFQELAEMAETCLGLPVSQVVDALTERESLGPTGVGQGVALPHARLAGIDSVKGLFVRLEKPLDFDSADRQPVDLVFALLAPDQDGIDHLKALARVSRTLRDSAICQKLRANSEPQVLHAILTEDPINQAA